MKTIPNGFVASILIGVGAFLTSLIFNRYHPFRYSWADVFDAAFFAVLVVSALQIRTRTQRPLSSVLYGCIGSVVLFRYVCWDGLFDRTGYDLRLALVFWAGVTLIVIAGIVALERADNIGR